MASWSKRIVFIISIIYCYFIVTIRWNGEDGNAWKNIISSDGKGYYAYLPAFFIYHDLKFKYLEDENNFPKNYSSSFISENKTGKINRYFCGVALLQSPFFLASLSLNPFANKPYTGYSRRFQLSISIASLFYFFIGLWYLRKVLLRFNFSEFNIGLVLILFSFGTNLFYYSVEGSSMSHVYSFSIITIFIYFLQKMFSNYSAKYFLILTVLLAIIILIRPVNGMIILLVPFFAGSFENLKTSIQNIIKQPAVLLISIAILFALFFIQFYLWYLQTDHWFVWSYKGEGFNFSHPEIFQSLFGFRKGLFIYTPLLFFSLFGLTIIYKNKFQLFWLLIFLFVLVFVTSSWWNWYYGSSFGMRPYIDFYVIFSILLSFSISKINDSKLKFVFYPLVTSVIILSGVQTYQYIHNIIHPEDMNFEKYKYVFFKTDKKYEFCLGGENNLTFGKLCEPPVQSVFNDFESQRIQWNNSTTEKINSKLFAGNYSASIDESIEFGPTYKTSSEKLVQYSRLFAKISLWKLEREQNASDNCLLVVSVDSENQENKSWDGYRINDLPHNEFNCWRKFEMEINIPKLNSKNDILSVYIWNREKKNLYIDNFKIEIFNVAD